jgi:hypothetical protein
VRAFLDDVRWAWTWWRFKRQRRRLEVDFFNMGAPKWHDVREENDILGVWRW